MAMEYFEFMTEEYQLIENQINKLKSSQDMDLSLYTGKTGTAIAYFLLAQINNHSTNHQKGEDLLIEVMTNLNYITNTKFTTGLTGIGWAIEFMSQKEMIKVNTDKVLYDFDDLLFKQVSCYKSKSLSLDEGLLGTAYYFYYRILAQSQRVMPYRQILNDRCLIFLIDEIKEFLYEDKTFNSTITAEHIDDKTLAQTFIFIYLCKQKGIDIEACNKMLWDLKVYITNKFLSDKNSASQHPYLLEAFRQIAKQTNDVNMLSHLENIYTPNKDFLKTNIKNYIYKDYKLNDDTPLSFIYRICKISNSTLWKAFFLFNAKL